MCIRWLASARCLLPSCGYRSAAMAVVALLAVAVLATACGDGEEPGEQSFSQSDEVIQQLVPDAGAFTLRVSSLDVESARNVELTASTALEGEPRMHVVSDDDAVAGADLIEEYEGFKIYRQKETFWAELVAGSPPLYAGSPSDDGLKAYVDFYRSGEPKLSDEQFQNGLRYAQDLIGEALQETPSLLIVNFDGEWQPGVGGIGVEAIAGERQLYVGVLYAREGAQTDAQEFNQDVIEAFKLTFAVPPEAQEQAENHDWGYANRIWYADADTAAGADEE